MISSMHLHFGLLLGALNAKQTRKNIKKVYKRVGGKSKKRYEEEQRIRKAVPRTLFFGCHSLMMPEHRTQ